MKERAKIPLILIGGGGHCVSCIDVIEQEAKYEIKGILDLPEKVGDNLLGYPIIGTDEVIEKHLKTHHFLITIGQIKSASIRQKIAEELIRLNAKIATIISPLAYISKHAIVGKGTIVLHFSKVNANARIGKHCILNTGCNIEHDVQIGDFCHISTHAVVNGSVQIKEAVFIGSSSVVNQGAAICSETIIGSLSCVGKSIKEKGVYLGNPIRRIEE